MKRLYLLRHAHAAPKEDYDNDLERPLTDKGVDQTTETAHKARTVRLKFDLIVTSPAVRAAQTAEIFANALGMRGRVVEDPLLLPGASLENMHKILKKYEDKKSVACVGHEPDFGIIAGSLLGLSQPRPLKKAEMIEIRLG